MSLLLFYVGKSGFAMDCRNILRVVPQVELDEMPSSPPYIAGLLNLAGKLVPVVDFCFMIEKRPTVKRLSSRIILLQDPRPPNRAMLAILGEKVNECIKIEEKNFEPSDFSFSPYSFIKGFITYRAEAIRMIDIKEFFQLISPQLFPLKE